MDTSRIKSLIQRFSLRAFASSREINRMWILAVLAVLTASGGRYTWLRAHRPMKPLEVSFWYWHTPYRIEAPEAAKLEAIGVKQLFVLAGTFRIQHDAVHLIMPQQWETAPAAFGVHLVFHFDSTLIREFENLPVEILARSLGPGITQAYDDAARAGIHVLGAQLDFDCPTRLLERYGELMPLLRPELRPGLALSATALSTWYTSRSVNLLMKQVDFLTPQYYEPTVSKNIEGASTISSLSLLQHGLRVAGSYDYPFFAGVPTYGHALLYSDSGKLLGMYHDMSVTSAMHQPAFRLVRAFGAKRDAMPGTVTRKVYVGEDIYDFKAVKPDEDGHGLGFHLVYDMPTPELLRSYIAVIAAERPRNCRGIILFRYPEAGEHSTLPMSSIASTLRGQKPAPDLKVTISSTAAPWAVVESGAKMERVPQDVMITVTNVGNAATFIAKDAVTLTLQFDRTGLDTVDPGDFEKAKTLFSEDGAFDHAVKASSLRSNTVRFYKSYLAPGETARIGPMETQAENVRGNWSAIGAGRLETYHGEIPTQRIGATVPANKPPRQRATNHSTGTK